MNTHIEDLESLRKRLDWSQERMAREVGVSFTTYNRWATGKVSKLHGTSVRVIELVLEQHKGGKLARA